MSQIWIVYIFKKLKMGAGKSKETETTNILIPVQAQTGSEDFSQHEYLWCMDLTSVDTIFIVLICVKIKLINNHSCYILVNLMVEM